MGFFSGLLGNFFAGGSGAPTAQAASVSGTTTGTVYTVSRLLGSSSTLALTSATNSNLTLSGAAINAATAIGAGSSQVAVVREVSGLVAIEYPVTITGTAVAATLGALSLSSTAFTTGSLLVRVHADDGPHYDRMIVVTEEDDGRALHLMGWIGEPLLPTEWAAARAALFPMAEEVRFERLRRGTLDKRVLRMSTGTDDRGPK